MPAYFEVDNFDDYLRMLEVCTRLTGQRSRYETYGTDIRAQVDAAVARQDGSAPRVLYVRATGSGVKAKGSEGSVLGEMLADLGCVNIADGGGLLENLSLDGGAIGFIPLRLSGEAGAGLQHPEVIVEAVHLEIGGGNARLFRGGQF